MPTIASRLTPCATVLLPAQRPAGKDVAHNRRGPAGSSRAKHRVEEEKHGHGRGDDRCGKQDAPGAAVLEREVTAGGNDGQRAVDFRGGRESPADAEKQRRPVAVMPSVVGDCDERDKRKGQKEGHDGVAAYVGDDGAADAAVEDERQRREEGEDRSADGDERGKIYEEGGAAHEGDVDLPERHDDALHVRQAAVPDIPRGAPAVVDVRDIERRYTRGPEARRVKDVFERRMVDDKGVFGRKAVGLGPSPLETEGQGRLDVKRLIPVMRQVVHVPVEDQRAQDQQRHCTGACLETSHRPGSSRRIDLPTAEFIVAERGMPTIAGARFSRRTAPHRKPKEQWCIRRPPTG